MAGRLLREIEGEVTELLSKLIRIDTSNPPGNEVKAAEFLADELGKEGFECEILESESGRGSIITRISGSGGKPSLLLLSHLDVVPAVADEWSVPPFSGLVKDGFVWGRGAVDCKNLVAAEVMVMKLLKRNNVKLKGDLIFAATADEEKGGRYGVGWLVKNHLDRIKAEYVINEGGGFSIPIGGRHVFTVQTSEKGVMWLKVRARGKPGHGSIPGAADNAVLRMAKVAHVLGDYRSRIRVTPTVRMFIEGLAKERGPTWQLLSRLLMNPLLADKILDEMAKSDLASAELLRAMLRNTIAPTVFHGGIKENIIPSECEAVFDCRVLPGEDRKSLLNEIRNVLVKARVELEKLEFSFLQAEEPSESPMNTPLYRYIENVLHSFEPNCRVVPFMMTGGTDSRFLRRVGCVCYGFCPLKVDVPLPEFLSMAHGVDERISIKNLVFSVSVLYELVKGFLA